MTILLTGVTGYIGKRLLPVLLEDGHNVICCVRDKKRFDPEDFHSDSITVIETNFMEPETLLNIPENIDAAYYLIHSMSASVSDFEKMEQECARNFKNRINETKAKQVIYLSGIVNATELSKHLKSRKGVEDILASGNFHMTTLRAGIIVGSGSASFEIIRDLVEKLPVMIAPKWLKTKSQPIAIRNVIQYLKTVLLLENSYDNSFDIGGPDIMTYKDLLMKYAKIRKLKRLIISVPVFSPRLSSYWLYFVTSTSYRLAINLVNSMKVEVICEANDLNLWTKIDLLTYEQAVKLAFDKIEQQEVISSWTDALSAQNIEDGVDKHLNVPEYGCLKDSRKMVVKDVDKTVAKIWSIGGDNGWYYGNWLWVIRGNLDKMFGGVGLRRGRKNPNDIKAGETLDFWRVLYASKKEKRMLLYAEMKLPGEAWLEFHINDNILTQTATFRPKGLFGRLYWYSMLPFHNFIFKGMMKHICQ